MMSLFEVAPALAYAPMTARSVLLNYREIAGKLTR
jgi:hypothetical protein